jgi:two-component system sensor histidine kinase FlrB
MKGVKTTPVPSLGQMSEWEIDAPSLNNGSSPLSRNPSLHVSIGCFDADNSGSQLLQPREEEHRQRLADLGEKVGQLAHDIRNPLSSIEWFATLLGRDHHSQEERQKLADHCIQAVRSLDHLVSNILVASAPLNAERKSVCLLSLLDDVELLAMYPLRKKGITIQRRQESKLSMIMGHESLLKQGLLNLLMNAIQASEPKSLIEIHCRNESRFFGEHGKQGSEEGVALRIRDYGCGMSEEELSNIFRPFYSKRKGGTGLGLSIVKQIVQIHHGFIDITSQEGKGTTVDLFFPQ